MLRVLERVDTDRRGCLLFLDEQQRLVAELTEHPNVDPAVTARLLHTLKGNASVFGVHTLASLCHDIEERISIGSSFDGTARELLATTWKVTAARMRKILGNRAGTTIEVSRQDYDHALSLMRELQTHPDVIRSVQDWDLDPVHARLERLGENAVSLAERLGKPELKIECHAGALRLENERWSSLWSACVHLVRNAVDHGIEPPEERVARGKSGSGLLVLEASVESNELVLAFEDDGAGIDWHRLEQKAVARGLPFANEPDRVAVLFADGLSSRDEASEVSGRGIGMGAVREEVRARGGSIHVNSTLGLGTRIELRCPVHVSN
jgi:two-component system chemotaxis sensor kinase CheA